jgi:capsular exopolysaccharide synthesis family protein
VVDKLSLDQDPEFVPELREKSWFQEKTRSAKRAIASVLSVRENTGEGGVGKQTNRELAIDNLISKLGVSVIRNTQVFLLKLETTSPQKSALIVNTVAESYIADQIASRLETVQQAAGSLNERVSELAADLTNAEKAAAEYRSQTERNVTEADVAASNNALKIARGRLSSFEGNLLETTGSIVPRTDRDLDRYTLLKENIAQLETILAKQNADLLELRRLDRDAFAAGEIYKHFASRLNEIEVQSGLQDSDIRILSPAIPRYDPTHPRTVMTVFFAGVLGLMLGIAFVIIRRLMDHSFNDAQELQSRFGVPVIGTLPKAPSKGRRDLLNYATKRTNSPLMEAIRDLRTAILISNTETSPQRGGVLALTSSLPSEGKTTTSVLLAVNTAALGKKVLLIECDLRRSMFESYFGRQHKGGLIDLLNQNSELHEQVWHEEKTGIDVIFGGISRAKNAGDIFASPEFSQLLEETRAHYDVIILDCPPVLPVPDARLIAKMSDYVLYAVRSSVTPSSTIAAGLRQFETIGVKVDGIALTQMSRREAYYGNYGYSAAN